MYYLRDHHIPIVSREQFERVEAIRKMRNTKKAGGNNYPLGDKLRCPCCQKPMIQRKILIYQQSRGWLCSRHHFLIQSKHVETALLVALQEADPEIIRPFFKKKWKKK